MYVHLTSREEGSGEVSQPSRGERGILIAGVLVHYGPFAG